jgi:hypothetical protein
MGMVTRSVVDDVRRFGVSAFQFLSASNDEFAGTKVSVFFKMRHHMSATKLLHGDCQHCAGHLEFQAEAAGTSAECPHCGQQTELFLSTSETPASQTSMKAIVFTVIAAVILIGGLTGSIMALNRAKRIAAGHKSEAQPAPKTNAIPAGPFGAQMFTVSEVKLEKSPGSSVVRATGTITNHLASRRFGVRVEIELLDELERPAGTATDYAATMEPGVTWDFKAVVLVKSAVAGRVVGIKEEK